MFIINVHHHLDGERNRIERQLHTVLKLLGDIMATQAELTKQVNDLTAKVTKIGTETRTLLDKIDQLQAVIDAGAEVSPELQKAVDDLSAQAEVVDGLVPDAPPPSP